MMEAWMDEELDLHSSGYGSTCSWSQGSLSQSQGLSLIPFVLVYFLSLEPHLVKLAYNLAIVSLVSHLNYHRNVWHMQDAPLHKSKLEA